MCFLPWWYMAAQRPPSTSRRGAVSVCAGQRSGGTLGAAPSVALRGVTWRKDPLVRGGPFSVPGADRRYAAVMTAILTSQAHGFYEHWDPR